MINRGSISLVIVHALVFVLPMRATYGQNASASVRAEAFPDLHYQFAIHHSQSSITDSLFTILTAQLQRDSLKRELLALEITKAELDAASSDFWHRLIPDIRISASLGVQQLVFIDPTTFTPYTLPKDSYRLTASLSLSDIFNSAKHDNALLTLTKLQTEYKLLEAEQEQKIVEQSRKRYQLELELHALEEELILTQKILDYKQLLFDQGKADFDDLVRAQLQVLNTTKSISKLKLELHK